MKKIPGIVHDLEAVGRPAFLDRPADSIQRNFRFISIVGFGCTLIATWEVVLTYVLLASCRSQCNIANADQYSLLEQGLTDGGTAGLIWGFLIVACGFLLVFLSLAEMASMYVAASNGCDLETYLC